jgi:hypothetical protein
MSRRDLYLIRRQVGRIDSNLAIHWCPMTDTKPKPETPPLSRAQRKIADATLAAAKFKPTPDGGAIRTFEVHGMAVTERVRTTDAPSTPPQPAVIAAPKAPAKEAGPQTPPLSRAQRKVADAALAAAKFVPSTDGKNAMRKFEVHGMAVTEYISADKAADTAKNKK